MIIPATVATLASTISAMPLQTLALTDAVTGVNVLQGVLFAFFDENNDSINDVTIEIFDVSTLQVNANELLNAICLAYTCMYVPVNNDAFKNIKFDDNLLGQLINQNDLYTLNVLKKETDG